MFWLPERTITRPCQKINHNVYCSFSCGKWGRYLLYIMWKKIDRWLASKVMTSDGLPTADRPACLLATPIKLLTDWSINHQLVEGNFSKNSNLSEYQSSVVICYSSPSWFFSCDKIRTLFSTTIYCYCLVKNSTTVEVWKCISNFISHFTRYLITYPC